MRRIAIIATCLAAVLGVAQPAMAADSTTLVKGFWIDDSTQSWPGIDQTPCGGTSVSGTFRGYYVDIAGSTPSVPLDPNLPSATRSWEFGFNTAPTEADAYGMSVSATMASQLQTLKLDVNGSSSGQASIYYWNANNFWAGKAAVTAAATGWSTVDASNLSFTWYQYSYGNNGGGVLITSVPSVAGTVAQFESAHGAPGYGYNAEIGFGCDNHPFSFQNLQFGTPGSVTTYNFSTLADRLAIGRSAAKIVAGSGVRITGASKFGYVGSVQLQARPATSSTWRTVATAPVGALHCATTGTGSSATTNCWSPFSAMVYPKVTTFYRWVDPGNAATDPGTSSATSVSVATRVTATWPMVYRGRTFAVNGSTYPAKPGSVVTLYGKHGTTTYVLGHATVTRYGTFRAFGTVRLSGTWSFWITIPATSGDLAGKSAVRSVYVR